MAGVDSWAAIEDVVPAPRRPRRRRTARDARGVHRPGRGPARRPGLPLRPHPRPVHHRPGRRPARARRRGGPAHAAAARRPGPGARRRVPAVRLRLGVVRRRRAPLAAAPVAGPAAQGGRAGPAGRPRPVPARLAARRPARGLRGVDGVLSAIDQLAGAPVPASALESLVLPARVRDYEPSYLDELTAAGEVLWAGHAALPGADGWVSLHLADQAPLTLPEHAPFEHCGAAPAGARRARSRRRVVLPPARRRGRARPTTAPCPRRCGSWSGRAGSATTPSPRCGR